MHDLFVHGRLRPGCGGPGPVSDAPFLGSAQTAQEYSLCIIKARPFVIKREASAIKGEVYSVDDPVLKLVDRLEGHPHVTRRELVPVRLEDGNTIDAWLYFYVQPLHDYTLVESGDFALWKKNPG